MIEIKHHIDSEEAMLALGNKLGGGVKGEATVFLTGDLGAGKTTLSRGILTALGHRGVVKSPTYTLVEPYALVGQPVYHFDLYRLSNPEELEFMGVRDYFSGPALRLVEWPERGEGFLPVADLVVTVVVKAPGRSVSMCAQTPLGEQILHVFSRC